MTASDFICDVFFIFSIIKNVRHEEKALRAKKKSTSGNRLYILNRAFPPSQPCIYFRKKSGLVVIVDCLTQIFLLSSFVWAFSFFYTPIRMKILSRQNFSSL